jgi:S-adenosylmethionine:tRNA ribosyltransferase-isomerase
MLTEDFDYNLPPELIAQEPAYPRDSCRLLVLDRASDTRTHCNFGNIIDYLYPGDLLVANNTRVMPARLLGRKEDTGGAAEVLLLKERQPDYGDGRAIWEGLVRPGRRLKPQARIEFFPSSTHAMVEPAKEERIKRVSHTSSEKPILRATVLDWIQNGEKGQRLIEIEALEGTLTEAVHRVGRAPLPPYITKYTGDPEMYQTVFSERERSAAAPTAGLHFTKELIERIKTHGVGFETVELEVGLDTFRIVDEEHPEDHHMHTERYHVRQAVIDRIESTKAAGGRVIAVGTTSLRSLESTWDAEANGMCATVPEGNCTSLFILPGYQFKVIDGLLTNFHVPRSTLMMLVSALATPAQIRVAYADAIAHQYRMLSFGDAMLIL